MDGLEIFEHQQWHPFAPFGFTHPFFAVEKHTIVYTWVSLGILLLIACIARIMLSYPNSISSYVIKKYIRLFMDNIQQSLHYFSYRYFAFITTLFTFLVICNCIVVIPAMEEPTKDLNSTLAFALITFLYVQKEAMKSHGLISYLNEYFKTPLQVFDRHASFSLWAVFDTIARIIANGIIAVLTFPIELLGKLASVLSLSFRLYGNIFGGAVINSLWMHFKAHSLAWQLIGLLSGFNVILILFFGVFEGLIQAFVFSMLSLMYLSMAVRSHQE